MFARMSERLVRKVFPLRIFEKFILRGKTSNVCPSDNEPLVRYRPTNIVQNPSFPYPIPPFLLFLTLQPPARPSPFPTAVRRPHYPTSPMLSTTTRKSTKYPGKPFSEKTPFILVFSLPVRTFAVLKMSSNGKS